MNRIFHKFAKIGLPIDNVIPKHLLEDKSFEELKLLRKYLDNRKDKLYFDIEFNILKYSFYNDDKGVEGR